MIKAAPLALPTLSQNPRLLISIVPEDLTGVACLALVHAPSLALGHVPMDETPGHIQEAQGTHDAGEGVQTAVTKDVTWEAEIVQNLTGALVCLV